MQDIAFEVIRQTAAGLGLAADRVLAEGKDNLTVPRPRIELQFMGETYQSLIKDLGITRFKDEQGNYQELKKQLYAVREDVGVNVLAEDAAWLKMFCAGFVKGMPRGVNDASGNWISIRAERAEGSEPVAKRVGLAEIKVLTKVSKLIVVRFEGRVTVTERAFLLEKINIGLPEFRRL